MAAEVETCPRCGDAHALLRCPHVKALEFEYGGDFNSIRRVEFLTPADFPQQKPPAAGEEPSEDFPTLKPMRGA